MPTYRCTTSHGLLNDERRAAVAREITRLWPRFWRSTAAASHDAGLLAEGAAPPDPVG
jgi:hypothetical protein